MKEGKNVRKVKLRECSYTILLCISFLVVVVAWEFGGLKAQDPKEIGQFLGDTAKNVWNGFFAEDASEPVSGEEMVAEIPITEVAGSEIVESESVQLAEPDAAESDDGLAVTDGEEELAVEFYHADISYFDDALFIGDSRTVGLYEYGGLGNAEVFAHSGMSIYKVFKEEFELRSGEMVMLGEILHKRQFGKIYIMLGINELGYDFDQTVERFGEAIVRIQEAQPGATIFIQANLHITDEKAEQSDIFNNENIDRYNQAISELADGKTIFYLDANTLYDDENGCLSKEFTTDHAHILGKYYVDWVDFILQNAVKEKE